MNPCVLSLLTLAATNCLSGWLALVNRFMTLLAGSSWLIIRMRLVYAGLHHCVEGHPSEYRLQQLVDYVHLSVLRQLHEEVPALNYPYEYSLPQRYMPTCCSAKLANGVKLSFDALWMKLSTSSLPNLLSNTTGMSSLIFISISKRLTSNTFEKTLANILVVLPPLRHP